MACCLIDLFLVKLVLAFIVGSIWITATTIVAERFGSKIGGLIGGLPSTSALALFFIGFSQSAHAASLSAIIVPIMMGINGVFLLTYAVLAKKRGFSLSFLTALLVWFSLATVIILLNVHNILIAIALYLPLAIFVYYVLEVRLKLKSLVRIKIKYTEMGILIRALFAGAVIAFAVLMGRYGGPVFGGVFSGFPAVFISTLVITNRTGGIEFSRSITKPLAVSGLITSVAYSIAVSQLYPVIGIWYGSVVAYLICVPFAYATYLFIKAKRIPRELPVQLAVQ